MAVAGNLKSSETFWVRSGLERTPEMRLGYFDAFSGASGDMVIGALIDAGLDAELLKAELAKLNLTGYRIDVSRDTRGSLIGTRFSVVLENKEQSRRKLADVKKIIDASRIDDLAKEKALAIFARLAEAEAAVHGTTPEEVHFHEVGAIDSIVDIVGTTIGITALGIERLESSPVAVGQGMISAAHGQLPVPAPAVVELLKGVPIRSSGEQAELTTPTGAAILVTLCSHFGPPPATVIESVGYGAGARKGRKVPNLLRIILGRSAEGAEADIAYLLEANIDDMTPEAIGAAANALFDAGAYDVFTTAVMMKKGRPGFLISCLLAPEDVTKVEDAFFRHTSTFGLRRTVVERCKLSRHFETVQTRYGEVRIKIGCRGENIIRAVPEYDDVLKASRCANVSFDTVYQESLQRYYKTK